MRYHNARKLLSEVDLRISRKLSSMTSTFGGHALVFAFEGTLLKKRARIL